MSIHTKIGETETQTVKGEKRTIRTYVRFETWDTEGYLQQFIIKKEAIEKLSKFLLLEDEYPLSDDERIEFYNVFKALIQ